MKRLAAILGYTLAGLTVLLTLATPFWFMGAVTRTISAAGIRPNPAYSGTPVARTILRDGYEIQVHEPFRRQAPCQEAPPFLQLDWNPAANLPAVLEEDVDLAGDGRPDLHVRFEVPKDPKAPLSADVTCTSGRVESVKGVRKQSLSLLCVRTGERIVLRVPLLDSAGAPGLPKG